MSSFIFLPLKNAFVYRNITKNDVVIENFQNFLAEMLVQYRKNRTETLLTYMTYLHITLTRHRKNTCCEDHTVTEACPGFFKARIHNGIWYITITLPCKSFSLAGWCFFIIENGVCGCRKFILFPMNFYILFCFIYCFNCSKVSNAKFINISSDLP